ncbi:MAG: carboxypeptidase regulatory-like domain-containing protein, partial [Candidatus Acidiferrales bacterium]
MYRTPSLQRILSSLCFVFLLAFAAIATCPTVGAQAITATLEGKVTDASGGAIVGATVTATNTSTQITRSAQTDELGDYRIALLPAGEYEVGAEQQGFQKAARKIRLTVAQVATLDFALAVGELAQQITVEAGAGVQETTRAEVSSVIVEQQIDMLPVNGRQFIDFALLAPGVTIGETTSGSTDVIVEPVTKLSFAGQNINYNLVLVDGADNMSTASGLQKSTPSQEGVQEFRVINTQYSAEAGRAVGGIVNIITKSGTNNWHGSAYWFIRNDALDADSILASPDATTCNTPGNIASGGCELLNNLEQNQYGLTLGGPIKKDRTFIFGNYEGQLRNESPFYNSVVIGNIDAINQAKTTLFGTLPAGAPGTLPAENLKVNRTADYNQFLVKADTALTDQHYVFLRYFFYDAEFLNVSPLNDGFDLPSGFKDNFITDNSIVGSLTSSLSPAWANDLRIQFAHRSFDFPTTSTQPHLEVANTFTIGVNRGNPDFYREPRFEISDAVTHTRG